MTGKQAVEWAKATAIIGGLLLGGYSTFVKGEPGADLAYKELAKSFNELRGQVAEDRAYRRGFIDGLGKPQPSPDVKPSVPQRQAVCERPKPAPVAELPVTRPPDAGQVDAESPPTNPVPARAKPAPLPKPMPPLLKQLKQQAL